MCMVPVAPPSPGVTPQYSVEREQYVDKMLPRTGLDMEGTYLVRGAPGWVG